MQTSSAIDQMIENGVYVLPTLLEPSSATAMLKKIQSARPFDASIFMDEATFNANPRYLHTNPGPGFNLLEDFSEDLAFVEQNPTLQQTLHTLIGVNYQCLLKKVICGVPKSWIPNWICQKIAGTAVKNLNCYIQPQYRNVTHFHGIDFHQDVIDWPEGRDGVKTKDMITLYVYLHDVSELDSPLYLLPKSHKMGATLFPHNLTRHKAQNNTWQYTDDQNRTSLVPELILTGQTGYCAMWHSCTLHGTMPIASEQRNTCLRPRISLRYLLTRSTTPSPLGIDAVNAAIGGPLSLKNTRKDLDETGKATLKVNHINNQ